MRLRQTQTAPASNLRDEPFSPPSSTSIESTAGLSIAKVQLLPVRVALPVKFLWPIQLLRFPRFIRHVTAAMSKFKHADAEQCQASDHREHYQIDRPRRPPVLRPQSRVISKNWPEPIKNDVIA